MNFRIIITINKEQVIFETASTQEEVNAILNSYQYTDPKNVTVFTQNAGNDYRITYKKTKEERVNTRPVGFGRW